MVACVALGMCSCGASAWRHGGHLRLTTTVKATFSLPPSGPSSLLEPLPLLLCDVPFDSAESVREPADLVPHRSRTDVTLVGHAHAPGRRAVSSMRVRLAIRRGGEVLLDKLAKVRATSALGQPRPFLRLALRYEHAYGGRNHAPNPVGVGAEPGDPPPPILHTDAPTQTVGFGPIAADWSPRRELRGSYAPDHAAPIFEVPDDLDWRFFHAAPADQQLETLHGDERIVLEHLHPAADKLVIALPGARASAAVYGLDGPGRHPVALRIDALHLDPDAGVCTLTWRGLVDLTDERQLDHLSLAADVGVEGVELTLPADAPTFLEPPLSLQSHHDRGVPVGSRTRTALPMHDDPMESSSPFELANPGQRRTAPPPDGAPWSPRAGTPLQAPAVDQTETISLRTFLPQLAELAKGEGPEEHPSSAPLGAPWSQPAPPVTPPAEGQEETVALGGFVVEAPGGVDSGQTLLADPLLAPAEPAPFQLAPPGSKSVAPASGAAPWHAPAAVEPASPRQEHTVLLDTFLAPAPVDSAFTLRPPAPAPPEQAPSGQGAPPVSAPVSAAPPTQATPGTRGAPPPPPAERRPGAKLDAQALIYGRKRPADD